MNAELLLQHFERLSEAPDAIPRLRRFILDLAGRGKLVEQDPNDEPAVELLERIIREKAQLVKEGKVRKPLVLKSIDDTETSFALPPNWVWVRVGDIFDYDAGVKRNPDELFQDRWLLELEDIEKDTSTVLARLRVNDRTSQSTKSEFEVGDILYGKLRPYLNKVVVADEPGYSTTEIVAIRPYLKLCSDYCALAFRRPDFVAYVERLGRGTKMPRLRTPDAIVAAFPLPPLAEQHRIVAKVDELMALCDRLESAQEEREGRRNRLAAASLHRLNNGVDADAFRDHARFYFNHLPRLTTRIEHILQLRQTILSLAVRGKLVPQDPSDEPAAELLKRIQAEKARLLKKGKIGPEKPPIPACVDKLIFELKPGWQAARISQILLELQTGPFGSSLHQSDYQKGGIPVINPASIKDERLAPVESMAVGPETLKRLSTFKVHVGDIVMARRGEMGRCAVVTKHEDGWLCGTGSLILRLPTCISPRFLVTLIGSPFVREYLGGSAVGATMQNLNQSILLNLVIGLPPLAEQHRIVAKVDGLMALCDQLEAQLTITETDSRRLLEAVVHEALAQAQGTTT